MLLEIEIGREGTEGRWIAEVIGLPGCVVYGPTQAEAVLKAQARALRVLADRLERDAAGPELMDVAFTTRQPVGSEENGRGQGVARPEPPRPPLERLRVSPADLERLCAEFQVAELSLFGSVLRSDFRSDSDVDVLVEFLPGSRVGFRHLARLQRLLGELFQRQVDLVPKSGLKPLVAKEVLPAARVIYAAGRAVPPGHPPGG